MVPPKPVAKIDTVGPIDINPEKAVGDYVESKQQDTYFVKPPNWDSAGESVEMLFINNAREHDAMLVLQKEMLNNSKLQTIKNKRRIDKLLKVQGNLRRRFIEVNTFLKDCVDKQKLAQKKVDEETKLHNELHDAIDKFNESRATLNDFRDVLKKTVEEYEPYESVVQDVVNESDILTDVKDCMDRCDALMLAQVEITSLENQKITEIEEMRKLMVKLTSEAALTVLGLKNDLIELERSYTQVRAECLRWEKILSSAQDAIAQHDVAKDRALDGIQNMYRILCHRRDHDVTLHRHEVEKEMDFIKEEMELLQLVLNECENESLPKGNKSAISTEKYPRC